MSLEPDIIVVNGTRQARAAKQASSTIPIVMYGVIDPVGRGLIANLAHPGGNVTGLADSPAEMEGSASSSLKRSPLSLPVSAISTSFGLEESETWT